VLAPNSPSCAGNATPKSGNVIASATSNHTGGVNVAVADGSVQFVSDTISSTTTPPTGKTAADMEFDVTSGRSNFGLWGAMGSIDGGESVTF
jgi:prepilin-type processing-associated H-X9-DG protein